MQKILTGALYGLGFGIGVTIVIFARSMWTGELKFLRAQLRAEREAEKAKKKNRDAPVDRSTPEPMSDEPKSNESL
jgi:hypothetical protein